MQGAGAPSLSNGKGPIEQIRSANTLISACPAGLAQQLPALIDSFGLLSLENECVNCQQQISIMARESRAALIRLRWVNTEGCLALRVPGMTPASARHCWSNGALAPWQEPDPKESLHKALLPQK